MNQQRPTIAIAANTAWNIYNFRLGLIRALIERGHKVVAIAPADDFIRPILETGASFETLHRLSRKGTNPVQDVRLVHEFYRHYQKHAVEVALQYTIKPNIYGTFGAGFAKTKTICTVTGLGYSFLSEGWVNRIVKYLYKRAFNRASLVAFQNQDDQQLFLDAGLVSDSKTLLIKGSGIRTDFFAPLPPTRTDGQFVFLFVGRLLYDKGVQELLDAAQILKNQYPKAEFWIVGAIDTDNPSAIKREQIEALDQQGIVRYLGPSNDVRSIMREADAVVLPSYREGIPRVMLEGLSMAKPLITTDAPGCRETVVDGHNGFLIPIKDSQSLAQALEKMLLLSPAERQRMGENGRLMALQEFDEQAIIFKYFELIDQLTKNH